MSSINAEDSRVNVLIRLIGSLLVILGIVMTILTSQNAGALQPEVIPVYYLCSTILMASGFVALVAKYKESGTPKTQ